MVSMFNFMLLVASYYNFDNNNNNVTTNKSFKNTLHSLKNAHSIVMNAQLRFLCMVATCYLFILVVNDSKKSQNNTKKKKHQVSMIIKDSQCFSVLPCVLTNSSY